jgi:hypothetical protein
MAEFVQIRITQSPAEDPSPGSGAVRLDDLLDLPPSQHVDNPVPGSGAMRLDDLLNPPPPPQRRAFETEVARVMQIRGLSRPEAERAAFENVLVGRLNSTFPRNRDPNVCAHCGRRETPDALFIPLGVGPHAWVHRPCADLWRARRREATIAELAAMGIAAP